MRAANTSEKVNEVQRLDRWSEVCSIKELIGFIIKIKKTQSRKPKMQEGIELNHTKPKP